MMDNTNQKGFSAITKQLIEGEVITGSQLRNALSPLSSNNYDFREISGIRNIMLANNFLAIKVSCSEYCYGSIITFLWNLLDAQVKHVVVGGCRSGQYVTGKADRIKYYAGEDEVVIEAPSKNEVSVLHINYTDTDPTVWEKTISCANMEDVFEYKMNIELQRCTLQLKEKHAERLAWLEKIEKKGEVE